MSENVQVAVRVRPFNEREKGLESECCIRMIKDSQQTIITDPETNTDKSFTFDYSYNSFVPPEDEEHASQDTVWNDIGVKVLEHAWNGFNVSLFAYGQTGAGKSFSMVGYGNDKGIIPRASEVIFERIDANPSSEIVFKVEASMMEIYNERVKDLFNPSSDNLKIRDHPRQGPYAEGLTRHAVTSYQEISRLMESGILARTTASTNMNATSSRAHTIFQIVVTQSEMNTLTGKLMDKVSRINLIDLAGSERATSTGATGARLKEGAAINQSLSALGNCISALADIAMGKKKVIVPYRNSTLTHLLKDSLGGNSKTIMIAALSPASVNYSETLSTLRYADRAKQIKNQAVVNEDPNQLLIRQLKEELESLRKAMMENVDPCRPMSRGFGSDGSNTRYSDNIEYVTRPINPEREREMAQIREQLEENQRLLKESEKSWNDRLKETEELAKRREDQLRVLGLATHTDDFKSKAMKEPHLLNLNEDQLLSEKLLYFIQDGMNKLGRIDAEEEQNIVLGGLGMMKEHCVIIRTQQDQEQISIRGLNGAKIYVNGIPLPMETDLVLNHCDRLILGNSNVFRMVIPSHRLDSDDVENESHWNWQVATQELHSAQVQANAQIEALAMKEKMEMDARVKKMEELMQLEHQTAEEKLQTQRKEWEAYVSQLHADMKSKEIEIKTQMVSEGESDKKRLAEQLAQQESRLAEELVKAEMAFEKKQQELIQKQMDLEASLQHQMQEAQLLGQQKERERKERLAFEDQLLFSIPLINEANSIAEEMHKPTVFAIKLLPCHPCPSILAIHEQEHGISHEITAELRVQVTFQEAGTYRSVLWSIEQFHSNLYLMRELYQLFIENNRNAVPTDDKDPFYDPPQPQRIGKAFVYLHSIVYGGRVNDLTPIYDTRGVVNGHVKCDINPTILSLNWQERQHALVETCPDNLNQLELPTLHEFIGSNIRLVIAIDSLRGIPGKFCKDTYVHIKWDQDEQHISPPCEAASVDPKIDFSVVLERSITKDLISFLQTHPIEIDVYGMVPSNNLNTVASTAIEMKRTESRVTNFLDVDAEQRGDRSVIRAGHSTRGRHPSVVQEEDESVMERYKEQIMIQERTLAENTLELEHRTQEVDQLQRALETSQRERDQLRNALEELVRTNKRLQLKLEQQIMKEEPPVDSSIPKQMEIPPTDVPASSTPDTTSPLKAKAAVYAVTAIHPKKDKGCNIM